VHEQQNLLQKNDLDEQEAKPDGAEVSQHAPQLRATRLPLASQDEQREYDQCDAGRQRLDDGRSQHQVTHFEQRHATATS
jgi:hypothetical protein